MKVYTVLIEDRHSDAEVKVFNDKEDAINYARKTAKEYCRFPEDYEERVIADWIFFAEYSCESDSVRVEEKEIIE